MDNPPLCKYQTKLRLHKNNNKRASKPRWVLPYLKLTRKLSKFQNKKSSRSLQIYSRHRTHLQNFSLKQVQQLRQISSFNLKLLLALIMNHRAYKETISFNLRQTLHMHHQHTSRNNEMFCISWMLHTKIEIWFFNRIREHRILRIRSECQNLISHIQQCLCSIDQITSVILTLTHFSLLSTFSKIHINIIWQQWN